MDKKIADLCQTYQENLDLLKKNYKWDSTEVQAITALMAAIEGERINLQAMDGAKDILKESTGAFSYFRGTIQLPSLYILSKESNPQAKMDKALDYYQTLKEIFSSSEFLALAALILVDIIDPAQLEVLGQRGQRIHQGMKKKHPFLTSSQDNFMAILLASKEGEIEGIVDRVEKSYTILKEEFGSADTIFSSSQLLVLSGEDYEDRSYKMIDLFNILKESGIKFSKYNDLSVLASLALSDKSQEEIVENIKKVDEALRQMASYKGLFAMDKGQRYIHDGLIVKGLEGSMEEDTYQSISTTIALVAAQQASLIAVMVSTMMVTNMTTSD